MFGRSPVRVSGDSMLPTLKDGQFVVVRDLKSDEPKPGQIVVAGTPGHLLIKRVANVEGEAVSVVGDNLESSRDSETFGSIPRDLVTGVATWRYPLLKRL